MYGNYGYESDIMLQNENLKAELKNYAFLGHDGPRFSPIIERREKLKKMLTVEEVQLISTLSIENSLSDIKRAIEILQKIVDNNIFDENNCDQYAYYPSWNPYPTNNIPTTPSDEITKHLKELDELERVVHEVKGDTSNNESV